MDLAPADVAATDLPATDLAATDLAEADLAEADVVRPDPTAEEAGLADAANAVTEATPEAVSPVAPTVEAGTEVAGVTAQDPSFGGTEPATAAPEVADAATPDASPDGPATDATGDVSGDVSGDVTVEAITTAPIVEAPTLGSETADISTPTTTGSDELDTAAAQAAQPSIDTDPVEAPQPQVAADVPGLSAPVPEPSAPPVLIADAEGVRVLQPARASEVAPEVLRTVALDTISYDDSGEVTVAGRATSAGSVRVYLDNDPVAEAPISEIGTWSTQLRDVATGVYTLRVDQLDADGAVLSRIETPFLREERATIAAVMAEETEREDFSVAVRTVQPGNTLWAIARERYGEGILYVAVFEANQDLIRDPDLIYPGQIFRLPELEDGQIAE